MTKAEKQARQAKALEYLQEDYYKPGDKIYCVLTHVSSSGMSRRVKVLHHSDTGISNVSYLVAAALGLRYNRDESSVVISGCGFDAACQLAYDLSYALWGSWAGCQLRYGWL